jgi:uncharacterized membrane protein (DUF2068 family)
MPIRHHSDPMIRLIALFKLVKAVALISIGVGAFTLRHGNSGSWLGEWIKALTVDPHGKYVDRFIARVSTLDVHQLKEIWIGSLLYAAVFVTEGIGLLFRKIWAELLTVIVTISFVPLEVYELLDRATWSRAAVLVANLAIVVYLLWRLRRQRVWPFHRHGAIAEKTMLP